MNYVDGILSSLTRVKDARSLRASSWDTEKTAVARETVILILAEN